MSARAEGPLPHAGCDEGALRHTGRDEGALRSIGPRPARELTNSTYQPSTRPCHREIDGSRSTVGSASRTRVQNWPSRWNVTSSRGSARSAVLTPYQRHAVSTNSATDALT